MGQDDSQSHDEVAHSVTSGRRRGSDPRLDEREADASREHVLWFLEAFLAKLDEERAA